PRVHLASESGSAEDATPPARPAAPLPPSAPGPVAAPNLEAASEQDAVRGPAGRGVGPLSPAVRRLIDEHGLDPAAIPASGKGGRLLKEDVIAYVDRGPGAQRATPVPSTAAAAPP